MTPAARAMEPASPSEAFAGIQGEWFSAPPRHEEAADLPAWYRELQADSWHQYLETPEPSRADENWRFADLKQIRFGQLRVAPPSLDAARMVELSRQRGLQQVSARFVFVNNRLAGAETAGLPDGVICLPMAEALATCGDLVRAHFMQEKARLGGGKFAALHGAASLSGVFLHAPRGAVVEHPVEICHWSGGENAVVFPHVLAIAEGGASVSLVERHRSLDDTSATLTLGVADLVAEDGGAIHYASVQNLNGRSRHIQLSHARVGRDARSTACFVNLGGAWTRAESVSRLLAPGADSQMLSANLADGDQQFDQRTLQSHEAEHTTSDLLYKNALYDRSRTIFAGLIRVCPGAHHTDAYQKCRNLLGSGEAEASSMPGLEIDADQVKCSHGSTSGPISDEEIFYLRARGIAPREARKIISQGFLNEVLVRLKGEELRGAIEERFRERFAELG